MTRVLASLILGLAMAAAATAAGAQSLVGTWSATINWNTPGGVIITVSFTPNGVVQSTTQNHDGQSYMLSGVYQFQNGVLQYKWNDYAPKQICTAYCTPAPVPAPLNVVNSENIQFMNANQFVATAQGVSIVYVRTNAAGFPTQ